MKKIIIIFTILAILAVSAWAISNQEQINGSKSTAVSAINPQDTKAFLSSSQFKLKANTTSDLPIIAAVDCPPGAQIEVEACGDDDNGGCLMPAGTESFESIACGVSVCGTYWSNDITRDTDWYELAIAVQGFVRWSAVGEAPTRIWVYDGSGGCDNAVWLASISANPDDTASVELELPAGTYWLVVGPDDWFNMPCDGSGDYANDYVASVTCELGAPLISVVPDNVYGEALEGFSTTEILTVSNIGEGRLNFIAEATQDIILQLAGNNNTIDMTDIDLQTLLAVEKTDAIEEINKKLQIKIAQKPGDTPIINLVDCPGDGIPEAEACGDDDNGGCAMAPGTEAFETFSCNTTVCGTVWSDGTTRDTDWFTLDLTEPTLFTWSVSADFPLLTLIILPGSTGNGCADFEAISIKTADPGDTAQIITSLPAGTYWLWVGPTGWYNMPCDGSGDYTNDYIATLKCEPPWLSIDVISGTIHEGDGPVEINVLMDAAELLPGTYTGNIEFKSNDQTNSPLDVPVVFVVNHVYEYIPGDANMGTSGWPAELTGADVTYLSNFFLRIVQGCEFDGFFASADANGDCRIIGSDVTYLVNYFNQIVPAPDGCPDFPHMPPVEETYPACSLMPLTIR